MDCKHCGAKVNAGTEWEAHLSRHQTIQNRVHAGRTYGVSYQRRPPRAIQTPTETPVTSQSTEVSVDKNADGKSDQVVCWALIADSYQPYGYRIEERYLSLPESSGLFKCEKCDLMYTSFRDCEIHAKSHQKENARCEHCGTLFDTSHQLDIHYDWHWGLQRDYEIEKAQASHKYPDREYSSIPERKKPSQKKRRDGEVVALSFVGPSDFTAGKW
ncbi:hypothetical protein ASPWEDRAFT_166808 [Aspergillus wentii DTO 134E9]|uniref:C2H2-type domain-containing protein n=1 Tax=Aspergillus wentii DTO 134E9 TaxID=1073089 RepID=A0A1L9S0P9_ASPWE|nr:uncharacterized protein ASPWEDRAFT_166808 [Aspergillus wentii DTO 134E9]OJJ40745.1 hypothetical protein ASPWEDRAFT_166808 [Aspergillus wentii DTO 134E9]